MKILYIASQTAQAETLALEREITDVQRQLSDASLQLAEIIFLPDITIETLPLELSRHRPDILHISVHGDREGLWFNRQGNGRGAGRKVHLMPSQLFDFLDPNALPRLAFFNACKSIEVAQYFASHGVLAIGTTAPITNDAAISASRLLYERLLGGQTVATAFRAIRSLVASMDDHTVQLEMFAPEGVQPQTLILQRLPRLAARLSPTVNIRPGGSVSMEFGIIGCPPDTCQVIFSTNDPSFITSPDTYENDLCEVVRDIPRRGEIWSQTPWEPSGNFPIIACGMTAGGMTFSLSGSAVDALQSYARTAQPSAAYEALLAQAVEHLLDNEGAGLSEWEQERQPPAAQSDEAT